MIDENVLSSICHTFGDKFNFFKTIEFDIYSIISTLL